MHYAAHREYWTGAKQSTCTVLSTNNFVSLEYCITEKKSILYSVQHTMFNWIENKSSITLVCTISGVMGEEKSW